MYKYIKYYNTLYSYILMIHYILFKNLLPFMNSEAHNNKSFVSSIIGLYLLSDVVNTN